MFEMVDALLGFFVIASSSLELGLTDVSSKVLSPVRRVISSVVGKPSVFIGNASLGSIVDVLRLRDWLPRYWWALLNFAVWSFELNAEFF